MDILGLIIGTTVLWILTYVVALPLARLFAGTEITTLNAVDSIPTGTEITTLDAIDSIPTETFVFVHSMVLGIAGLLLGSFFGLYFIGFAWKAKMWPGLIALMVASMYSSGYNPFSN